jgi:hypothetical protein
MAIFLQVETRVWESFGSGKVNHAQHDKKKIGRTCIAGDLHLRSGQHFNAGRHGHLVNKTALQ